VEDIFNLFEGIIGLQVKEIFVTSTLSWKRPQCEILLCT